MNAFCKRRKMALKFKVISVCKSTIKAFFLFSVATGFNIQQRAEQEQERSSEKHASNLDDEHRSEQKQRTVFHAANMMSLKTRMSVTPQPTLKRTEQCRAGTLLELPIWSNTKQHNKNTYEMGDKTASLVWDSGTWVKEMKT